MVFGWNQGQRQSCKLGKTTQSFVQIPTARLKERVEQLCQQYGIRFVETEEANTSAAWFVDGDSLPKFGEKPEGEDTGFEETSNPRDVRWKSSGKLVKRGLFRTAHDWYLHADAQAAANIIRKVSTTLGLDLSEVCRGALTRPQRIRLWSAQKTRSHCTLVSCVASA